MFKTYLPEYDVWNNMRQRCENPKVPFYHRYGGRGISVCKRWMKFEHFYSDMGPRPSPLHQLERKNNLLGYFPENCLWILAKDQQKNTRRTIRVMHSGLTLCLKDWCKRLGLSYVAVRYRIYRGASPQAAMRLKPADKLKGQNE